MIVGQKVEIVTAKGRRPVAGVIVAINGHLADVLVKPGHIESYHVVGATCVEKYPEPGQFTLAEDDDAAELRLMEEAEARAAAELAAAKTASGPGVTTPDTQDPLRDENGNLVVETAPAPEPISVPDDGDNNE